MDRLYEIRQGCGARRRWRRPVIHTPSQQDIEDQWRRIRSRFKETPAKQSSGRTGQESMGIRLDSSTTVFKIIPHFLNLMKKNPDTTKISTFSLMLHGHVPSSSPAESSFLIEFCHFFPISCDTVPLTCQPTSPASPSLLFIRNLSWLHLAVESVWTFCNKPAFPHQRHQLSSFWSLTALEPWVCAIGCFISFLHQLSICHSSYTVSTFFPPLYLTPVQHSFTVYFCSVFYFPTSLCVSCICLLSIVVYLC